MERHNEAAVDAILQGMAWLGTPLDGVIVRQRETIGPGDRGGVTEYASAGAVFVQL